MAQKNIKAFMVNRLVDLDPSLATEDGAAIYTKVINPLIQRLGQDPMSVDIETFILSRMRDEFPEFDIHSPGSVLKDLLINPLKILLEPLRREVNFLQTQNSLANESALEDVEIDALLSNVFSYRQPGTFSYGLIRLYFSAKQTVGIDKSIQFIASNGTVFVAEDTETYSPADMVKTGNLYYLDVPVRSSTPNIDANIGKGEITNVQGLDNVVKLTNLTSMSGGTSRETSEDFLTRASRSLSERSLNTERGIETKIFSNFDGITSVDVVGYGEPEMQRDIVQAEATIVGEETVGPLLFSSSSFYTHPVIEHAGGTGVFVPFTNTLVFKNVSTVDLIEMKAAKYLKIVDGNGYYDPTLLGRVREVDIVFKVATNNPEVPGVNLVFVRVKDFSVFPEQAAPNDGVTPQPVGTSDPYSGMNKFSTQGVDYYLYRDNGGVDHVAGAPLPFDDNIYLTFDNSKIPSEALVGRDFLYVLSHTVVDPLELNFPFYSRMYPIRNYFVSGNFAKIDRIDGRLVEKDKIVYPGKTEFSFPLNDSPSAGSTGPRIRGFGSPKISDLAVGVIGDAYNGIAVESFNDSPGVSIEPVDVGANIFTPFNMLGRFGDARDLNPQMTLVGTTYTTKECDVRLHSSVSSWVARSVSEGDFVSLAAYDDAFSGTVETHHQHLVWQGFGKVKTIDSLDPRRLRVEGLDVTPLVRGESNFSSPDKGAFSSSYGWLKFGEEDYSYWDPAHANYQAPGLMQFNCHFSNTYFADGTSVDLVLSAPTGAADAAAKFLNAFLAQSVPGSPLSGFKAFYGNDATHARWLDSLGLPKLSNYVYIRAIPGLWPGGAWNGDKITMRGKIIFTGGFLAPFPISTSYWGAGAVDGALDSYTGLGGGIDGSPVSAKQVGFQLTNPAANDLADLTTTLGPEVFNAVDIKTSVANVYELELSSKGDSRASLSWWGPSPVANPALQRKSFATVRLKNGAGAVVNQLQFLLPGIQKLPGVPGADPSVPYVWSAVQSTGGLEVYAHFNETTGKIEIHNTSQLPFVTAEVHYWSIPNRYKFYWTIYKGQTEVVAPNGHISMSYDDLAFAPAYKKMDALTEVAVPGAASYVAAGFSSATQDNSLSAYTKTNAVENGLAPRFTKAVWIRLGKSFNIDHQSLHAAPVELCSGGEIVETGQWSTADTTAIQGDYSKSRYASPFYYTAGGDPNDTGQDIDQDAGADRYLTLQNSLPVSVGAVKVTGFASDAPVIDFTVTKVNPLAVFGFLIPHPMGSLWADPTNLVGGNTLGGTVIETDHLLMNQVVEFYAAAKTTLEEADILVSGIPGSVPLPGITSGLELEIDNDEFHIGGMTDVYLKAGSEELSTTPPIMMHPETLGASEVIFSGSDGTINTLAVDPTHNANVFFSQTLLNKMLSEFGGDPGLNTNVSLNNVAIELLNLPSNDIKPRIFRALTTVSGGVLIDGTFEPDNVSYPNLKFRVVRTCTTSLDAPVSVLQQGASLHTVKNSFNVFNPEGFDLNTDLESSVIYLDIENDGVIESFEVASIFLNQLTLDRVVSYTKQNLDFSVYTKQSGGVDLPIVRVKSVSLSGEEGQVVVPYKDPVDIKASSFSGLNDDPITQAHTQVLTLENRLVSELMDIDGSLNKSGVFRHFAPTDYVVCLEAKEGGTTGNILDTENFVDWGVIKYDVARLDYLEDPNRYFYVLGVTTSSNVDADHKAMRNVLILDRKADIGDIVDIPFYTIGHPSIGKATVYFKDQTYFEIGPETTFSYKDDTTDQLIYFRPSPAETAVMFKSDVISTDAVIGDGGDTITTSSSLLKHDVKPTDRVQIHTKVLYTGGFDSTLGLHENLVLSGKVLALAINGTKKAIIFSGPNPMTLSAAAADMNLQLGGLAQALVEADEDDPTIYRIALYSSNHLLLLNEGTLGIFDILKIGGTLSAKDNTAANDAQEDFTDIFDISSLSYDTDSGKTTINIDPEGANELPENPGAKVFITIVRERSQNAYPASLEKTSTGLYTVEMKLTSYDPLTVETVKADQALSVANHKSLGYSIDVKNSNYTYSLGEKSSLKVTSVIMGSAATAFDKIYVLPGAEVTIEYERSSEVEDVQYFMLLPPERVVNNNPLVRHYFPAYAMLDISYSGGPSVTTTIAALEDYFVSRYPNLPVNLYDIISQLTRLNASSVTLPLDAAFLTHDENRVIGVVRSDDIVALNKRFHIMGDMSRVIVNKVG